MDCAKVVTITSPFLSISIFVKGVTLKLRQAHNQVKPRLSKLDKMKTAG